MRVGIEVGGTFTDLVAIGPDGIRVTKVPSVPRAPDEGAFNALLASGIAIASIEDLAHGSTVATNAVLERKGFPTAFVTTQGFRDILALQRHGRSRIYDLEYQKPKPVVTRAASFEVAERILADGTVETPLDVDDVRRRLVPALKAGALRGRRHLSPQCLRQSGAREGAARVAGRGAARSARHDLLRHHARVPRIRARLDDDAVGLRPAGDRPLHRTASGSGSTQPVSAAVSR